MLKKMALAALATSFALTTSPAAHSAVTFENLLVKNGGDIPNDHWAIESIKALVDKYQIMSGFPDNTFKGEKLLNRYEMAAALYKIMQIVETRSGKVGGADIAEIEKLKTLLEAELEAFRKDQAKFKKAFDLLTAIKISGKVEVRYRDRISVTDGTDNNSPLFKAENTKNNNNNGDHVLNAQSLPQTFNNPANSNITRNDSNPFRIQNRLHIDAALSQGLQVFTRFDMYENGVSNGGHDGNEGTSNSSQFALRHAYIDMFDRNEKGQGVSFRLGFMNFANSIRTGTTLNNHFSNSQWNGHGYGLVGFGGSQKQVFNTGKDKFQNSVSRYWVGGLDVSEVDPDSLYYNQVSSPSAAFDLGWEWGRFSVGLNYGSPMTNRQIAAQGNLSGLYAGANTLSGISQSVLGSNNIFFKDNISNIYAGAHLTSLDRKGQLTSGLLALPSQYGDGYGVLGLELNFLQNFFPIRVGLHARSYLNDNMLDFNRLSRKALSGVLDLGWQENFGMTFQVNRSFIGYDKHSMGFLFNNIAGSGYDVQLATNLATRGIFNIFDVATGSVGLVVGIPFMDEGEGKDNIKLLLSARQSIGDNFGNVPESEGFQLFKDSGVTASLLYNNVSGSPLNLRFEYSLLESEALWDFRPVAHDLSVIASYNF